MRRTRFTIAAGLLALGIVAAACGNDESTTTEPVAAAETADAAASTPSGDKPTIKLVENAWTASVINTELAKQLIETQLGNKVEVVKIDENTMFTGLSSGDLDAVLEIWPSGVNADEQKFFTDKTVVDVGPLGAVGKIGWWVPDYVLEKNPELATWEGFKSADLAKLFATAETGDQGRFLGTDPSYSQYDESIVAGLGLPLKVVFSGSEAATVAELDSRVAAKEPIVMYWWTPTAAVAKYNLKNVALPQYTEECYADKKKIACDYPEDKLFKAVSAKLSEKDARVAEFLSKFQLTTEDQLAMLPAVEIDKRPASEVVGEWIAANEATWKPWIPAA